MARKANALRALLRNIQLQNQSEYRLEIGSGVIQLGNIALASSVFPQLFSEKKLNIVILLSGLFIFTVCYISAIFYMRKGEENGTHS